MLSIRIFFEDVRVEDVPALLVCSLARLSSR